jgi:tRNA nucleotidyltransferase (CCA-adding enzyme)
MWYRVVLAAAQQGEVYHQPLNIPVSGTLRRILDALAQSDRRALIVGGSVRDALQGMVPKDIDIEVYGTSYDDLVAILSRFGQVDVVGKSFGVIKLRDEEGNDFDFSIPRRESKTGVGHRDFAVSFDAGITPKEAASRRDFTINALAYDPLSEEVHDYFGGVNDLQNKVLRHTSPAFAEDPLRVLRGMQFAARFGMDLAPETAKMIREELSEDDHYHSLAKERISEEFMKLATKGQFPGRALQYLKDTGWIRFFPQLEAIVGVPQDEEWHPEGDVDIHTAHVMDAAAEIADRDGLKGDDRAALIFAAMGHDLAKATTTEQREKGGRMRWTAHGHEEASGPMAEELMKSIGIKKEIIQRVRPIIERHLEHIRFKPGTTSPAQVRQLADALHPATIEELARLMEADASGRPPLPKGLPEEARLMLELARQDGSHAGRPQPLVQGRDVMPYFQNQGGKHIGEAVQEAYKAQLKAKITTVEQARAWLDNHIKSRASLLRGTDVLPYFDNKGGPHIADVLTQAWQAQRAGEFDSPEGARAWLDAYMQNQPPASS